MPFDNPFPRSFTANSIRSNAPTVPGVYGISNARQWIFIGRSGDIRAALMEHITEPGTAREQPSGFVFEPCDGAQQASRLEMLIREYAPVRRP